MVPLACSGPGAAEAIVRATVLGWALLAVTGAGVAAGAGLRRVLGASLASPGSVAGYALVALHPAWCISAAGGDCGVLREMLSWGWSAVGGAWLVGSVGWALAARRRAARATDGTPPDGA